MAVTNINLENFDQQVTNAASPVLVDFWAAWCGPCSMLSPVVEELAQEHPEIAFGKVNVDEAPELAQKYQISAIPTLLLFRDGKPVDMSVGVKSKKELEAFLK
ncbi:MAG: thioredoxin [Clostridiales bacterium]|nr:thioredoxin [Clostridiales bacterium]